MRLSATRVATYRTCPRQYRYRYVDGLPTLLTPQLAFGRVVHETLCALHQACIEGARRITDDMAIREFRRRWWVLASEEPTLFSDDAKMRHGYRVLGEDILRGYVAEFGSKPLPVAVEFPFEVPWERETIVGFVDRVDEVDGGIEVREFKTGKRKPSRKELDDDLQLLLYTHAVGEALGLPVRRAVYHHLRSASSVSTDRDESTCREQVNDVLGRVVPAIRAGRHPPRSGWWCRFCDYRHMCEREGPEELRLPPAPLCVNVPTKGVDPWP